ncbi:hypothetical protein AK88_01220 [Plasmodium fragile]|uniref:VPS9 domain-containing protein n=1 Tax=Plasmodium fragile TaxID=5857 RepID=A0A0D9QQ14_PLAFR|nr:uncharacterized protein AK88_01220 [Plasmodium fragile]KJP89134.1 hypothetical protein AK88_01220 [Plasmodium fragile]
MYSRSYLCEDDEWGVQGEGLPVEMTGGDEMNEEDFFCSNLEGTHGRRKAPQLSSTGNVLSGSEAKLVRGSSKQSLPRGEDHHTTRHASVRNAAVRHTSVRHASIRDASIPDATSMRCSTDVHSARSALWFDSNESMPSQGGRRIKEKQKGEQINKGVDHRTNVLSEDVGQGLTQVKANMNSSFDLWESNSHPVDNPDGEVQQLEEDLLLKRKTNLYNYKFISGGETSHEVDRCGDWGQLSHQDMCHDDYMNGGRTEHSSVTVRASGESRYLHIKQKQVKEVGSREGGGRRSSSSAHINKVKKTPSSRSLLHDSNMSSHQNGSARGSVSSMRSHQMDHPHEEEKKITNSKKESVRRSVRGTDRLMRSVSTTLSEPSGKPNTQVSLIMSSSSSRGGDDARGTQGRRPVPRDDLNDTRGKVKTNMKKKKEKNSNNEMVSSSDDEGRLLDTTALSEESKFFREIKEYLNYKNRVGANDAEDAEDASAGVTTQRGHKDPLEWDIQLNRSDKSLTKRRSSSRKKQPPRESSPCEGETHTDPTSHQRSGSGKPVSQNVGQEGQRRKEQEGGLVANQHYYNEVNAQGVQHTNIYTQLTLRGEPMERVEGVTDRSSEEETSQAECKGVALSGHVSTNEKHPTTELGKKRHDTLYSPDRNVIKREERVAKGEGVVEQERKKEENLNTEEVEQHPPPLNDECGNGVGNNPVGGESGLRIRFPFPQRGKKFKDIFISLIKRGDAGRSPEDGSNGQASLQRDNAQQAEQEAGQAGQAAETGDAADVGEANEEGEADEANSGSRRKPNTLYNNFLESLKHPSCRSVIDQVRTFIHRFPKDVSREAAAKKIHEFINETQPILLHCAIYKNVNKYQANVIIEGYEKFLLQKLHPHVYRMDPKDKDEDEKIYTKINCLQWVELKHLEITQGIQLERLKQAQAELMRIQKMRAPNDKLIMVLNCCRIVTAAVYAAKKSSRRKRGGKKHAVRQRGDLVTVEENVETTVESDGQDSHRDGDEGHVAHTADAAEVEQDDDELLPCADEVLPVIIYVIIKTNPPELISNIAYIQNFRHPNHFVSEEAYSFTQFCSGVEFIKELGKSTFLNMPEEEYKEKVSQAKQFYLDEVKESNKKLQEAAGKLTNFIKLSNEKKLCVNVINKIEAVPLRFEGEDNFNGLTVSQLADLFEEYKLLVRMKNDILRDMQEHEQALSAGDA